MFEAMSPGTLIFSPIAPRGQIAELAGVIVAPFRRVM